MDRTPKPMEQYVHFKGGRYQVLNLAEMEDTGETLVIYQALYGEGKIYARTLSSFISEVDRTRYPDAAQHWRFLRVVPPEEAQENRFDALCRTASVCPPEPTGSLSAERTISEREEGYPRKAGLPEPEASSCRKNISSEPEASSCRENISSEPEASSCREDISPEPEAFSGSRDIPEPDEEEPALDPVVLRFLDADSADEKLSVLLSERGRITDDMIDTMAFALGIEVEPGPIDERYLDLRECLLTISRYEMDRGRFRTT